MRGLLGLAGAIGLACWGQQLLSNSASAVDALLLYGLSLLLLRWVLDRYPGPVVEASPPPQPSPARGEGVWPPSPMLLYLAIGLAAVAWLSFAGNRFTAFNLVVWLAAVGLFLWHFWDRSVGSPRLGGYGSAPRAGVMEIWSFQIPRRILVLGAILLLAAFFRFFQLDRFPPEMTSDHAEKLQDVWDVLTGQYPVFFLRNTGREAFQFYLTAGIIKVFGLPVSHMALKLGTAAVGLWTIPWLYLLGAELFGHEAGLLGAALAAVSLWPTAITRFGLRFPFTPAFAAPALYFLVRAFKGNRRNDWLLCGVFLGIGLHTYSPFRAVPLLVAALCGAKLVLDFIARPGPTPSPSMGEGGGEDEPSEVTPPLASSLQRDGYGETTALAPSFWGNATLAAATTALVFLPLGRFMAEQPQAVLFRSMTRLGELERPYPGNPLLVFLDNVKNALLLFNYRGDEVWAGLPALDKVTAALWVLGMAMLVWLLWRRSDRRSIYLLIMLFFLFIPSTTSIAFPNENPSISRAGGAIVVVFLIAALPLDLLRRWVARAALGLRAWGRDQAALCGLAVVSVILALATVFNYDLYFNHEAQLWRGKWNTTEMGAVVQGFVTSVGKYENAYHVPYPHWADTRNIGFKAGNPTWNSALALDTPAGAQRLREQAVSPENKLYLVHPDDARALSLLRAAYPQGQATLHRSKTPNMDFFSFFAPGPPQR